MKANARQYTESLLAAQTDGTHSSEKLITGLSQVVSRKGKVKMLKKILATLISKEEEAKGIENVIIETAYSADAATQKKLKSVAEDMYPGKKLEIQFVENKEIQSGYRIKSKNWELDQTFKTRASKLHKQLI